MQLSTSQAAAVIGCSVPTLIKNIRRGLLAARHVGYRGVIRIDVAELRRFAAEYEYIVNEDMLRDILGRVE